MRLDIIDDTVVLIERLSGLRIEIDVTGEIKTFDLVEALNDDGC